MSSKIDSEIWTLIREKATSSTPESQAGHTRASWAPEHGVRLSGRLVLATRGRLGQGLCRPVPVSAQNETASRQPLGGAARLTDRNVPTPGTPIRQSLENRDRLPGLLPSQSPLWAFLRAPSDFQTATRLPPRSPHAKTQTPRPQSKGHRCGLIPSPGVATCSLPALIPKKTLVKAGT